VELLEFVVSVSFVTVVPLCELLFEGTVFLLPDVAVLQPAKIIENTITIDTIIIKIFFILAS
jgi:hypothetical protein